MFVDNQNGATTYRGFATVVATANDGPPNIVLDRTLFYPQGGGQRADKGWIAGQTVEHVATDPDGLVRHFVAAPASVRIGETVQIEVDEPWRRLNSRLHTAGHLIASLVEIMQPDVKACAGHHWPGEARVDFTGQIRGEDADLEARLREMLDAAIRSDPRVTTFLDRDGRRFVRIENFAAYACGGTHVARLGELISVSLRGTRKKGNKLRIGYDLGAG
jgi:alanyl-tRNA synthetase